jgi:aminopeptidase C
MTNEEIEYVVRVIFFSPATNGQAESSIAAGVEKVKALIAAERQKLIEQAGGVTDNDVWKWKTAMDSKRGVSMHDMVSFVRDRMAAAILKEREERDGEVVALTKWMHENRWRSNWPERGWFRTFSTGPEYKTTDEILAEFRRQNP